VRGTDFVSLSTLDQLGHASDLTQQRRDAIAASDVAVDERIGVPANASRALVDAVTFLTSARSAIIECWSMPEMPS